VACDARLDFRHSGSRSPITPQLQAAFAPPPKKTYVWSISTNFREACLLSTDPPRPCVSIAHLAETPFGFLASTFLPITPQTPKHLGFGFAMPFRVRRDTPFVLKTPASWRNGFFDSELFDLRYSANGFFNLRWSYFSAVQVKTKAS
jgi:hypothetical protein